MFKKLWNRMLTVPEPKRPVRDLSLAIGLSFGGGVLFAVFSPMSESAWFWAFPLQVTLMGAGASFFSTGAFLLGPVGRRRGVLAIMAILPLMVAMAFYLFTVLSAMDFSNMPSEQALDLMWAGSYLCMATMAVVAGCGWVRWLRDSRSGRQ